MPQPLLRHASEEGRPQWPAFSTDAFLDVIRDVYRPGWHKAFVSCQGQAFRTLVSPRGDPLVGLWEFPLFFEPVVTAEQVTPVPYLDSVCHGITTAGGNRRPGLAASPFINWAGVTGSWDEYVGRRTHARGTDGFEALLRKERALNRDAGDVEVCFDDHDPAVLETLFAWKSAQYRRTGLVDLFALQRNRDFNGELARRGLLEVASLRAGGKLIAAHAGSRLDGRFLYRLPAYDPQFRRFSPGALLTWRLVRHSFESGDREFDFLLGDEAYKFTYATHVRWIGPLGTEPLRRKAVRTARGFAGRARRAVRGRLRASAVHGRR